MSIKKFTVGAVSRKQTYGHYGVKIDGTDTWVNVKSIDGIERGAVLKAEVIKKKDRWYASNVKVISEGAAPSSGGGGGSYAGKSGGGKGGYGDPERNAQIVWQHSQEMAISAVDLLIRNDAAKLGAKTKVEERKTTIIDMIDELTVHFFNEVAARKALKKAKEIDEDLGDEDEGDESDDADDELEGDDGDSDESDDDDDPFGS